MQLFRNLRKPWGVLGKIREYSRLLGYLPPLELPPLNSLESFGAKELRIVEAARVV